MGLLKWQGACGQVDTLAGDHCLITLCGPCSAAPFRWSLCLRRARRNYSSIEWAAGKDFSQVFIWNFLVGFFFFISSIFEHTSANVHVQSCINLGIKV